MPCRYCTSKQDKSFEGNDGSNYHKKVGAGERSRTPDRLITSQLLYQLSYASQAICGLLSVLKEGIMCNFGRHKVSYSSG